MARPRKSSALRTVSVRLPSELLQRIDDCTADLRRELPLLEVTRTDAIRFLLQSGLERYAKKGLRLK